MNEDNPHNGKVYCMPLSAIVLALITVALLISVGFSRVIFNSLTDAPLVRGFVFMMLQVGLVAILGGSIGLAFGWLVNRSEWLASVFKRILHVGQWILFIYIWAFPLWWGGTGRKSSEFILHMRVWLTQAIVLTIALAPVGTYLYLRIRSVQKNRVGRDVFRLVTFEALLYSMITQVLLPPRYGWDWIGFLVASQSI